MINTKILNYNQKLLSAWINFEAGCSSPDYFGCQAGTLGLSLQQNPDEYSQLLKWFQSHNFESYLELGIGRGGSFLLNVMFQPNLKFAVAVDNSVYWKDDQKKSIEEKIEWLKGQGKDVLFKDTSTDIYFSEQLNADYKFDCIFIDADHSYEGVKRDFDNSLNHIKKGGYIIFHDIASIYCQGVQRIWKEAISKYNEHATFIKGTNTGIGIIQVNE